MAFVDVQAKTIIDPAFSAADRAVIIGAIQTAYNGSPTARVMFDDWIATGKSISINYAPNAANATLNSGNMRIDLSYISTLDMITNTGRAVEVTPLEVIIHELVHALTGRDDAPGKNAPAIGVLDYRGETVTFTNIIERELGIPERNSYRGVAETGTILTRGFEYTNGAAIDRSVVGDRDWSTWTALVSNDLLVGGPSANRLESGLGNDFLFGGGGDDYLNGGLFGTDTAVLTGKPIDYDIRLNPDGTWTSRHIRGTMTEGTDTFVNLEKVRFAGSNQNYDLTKGGLTFQRDIAFVVDQTGSMSDDVDAVKATAAGIINGLFAGNTIDARIGIVGFRDSTIGEPTTVLLPFTDQDSFADRQAAALSGINSISVSGGGDFPETAFEGLLMALNGTMGSWRVGAGTKQVILFTDASAKDAFLLPTVMSYALDIGATITRSSSAALGTLGAVDTFDLSFVAGTAGFFPGSEDDPPPVYIPSDDPIQAPGGTAKVQIFTIFIETFISPDPAFIEVSDASGGSVLTAATPEEVVARLLEVISSGNLANRPFFGSVDTSLESTGGQLYGLYEGLLNRAPDTLGLESWAEALESGATLSGVANGFLQSEEYTTRFGPVAAESDAGFVEELYEGVLGRAPDSEGLANWVAALQNGMSRADVALGFALSDENLSSIEEVISAGIFVPNQEASEAARFYHGILDRAPDGPGLQYWTGLIEGGESLSGVAALFLASEEYQAATGGLDDESFVTALYQNSLGRAPDPGGFDTWLEALELGASRADVATGIIQNAEAENHLLPQVQEGWLLI